VALGEAGHPARQATRVHLQPPSAHAADRTLYRVDDLAKTVLDRLTAEYSAAADPTTAAPMAAYMRGMFPFLGVPTGRRRELSRRVLTGLSRPTEAVLTDVALGCWALPEREYQYFACDWLRRHARVLTPEFLPTVRTLITEKSWWDTVDTLAAHVVGTIVARHPATVSTMDEWAASEELWLVRAAILHQIRYGEGTDEERLFRYCVLRATHPDFFIRKAIGWAMREYARTDPDAVRRFVKAQTSLSPLSVREALKHL
jgi:3-methyladenine DNA glycosylase AlkD